MFTGYKLDLPAGAWELQFGSVAVAPVPSTKTFPPHSWPHNPETAIQAVGFFAEGKRSDRTRSPVRLRLFQLQLVNGGWSQWQAEGL